MTMTETNPFTEGQQLWSEYRDFINRTADNIAYSYVKVEKEDVLQEIYVFLWEKEKYFLDQNRPPEYIKTSITNVAKNYAKKQRSIMLVETDTFYYSADEVKAMLPTFLSSYEGWTNVEVPDGADSYDKFDALVLMSDFAVAWERLTETQKDFLVRKYASDEDFPEPKDRMQVSRALRRLWTILNTNTDIKAKNHQGPGSRKAITNIDGITKAQRLVNDK